MATFAQLGIEIDPTAAQRGAQVVKQELRGISDAAAQTQDQIARGTGAVATAAQNSAASLQRLTPAATAAAAAAKSIGTASIASAQEAARNVQNLERQYQELRQQSQTQAQAQVQQAQPVDPFEGFATEFRSGFIEGVTNELRDMGLQGAITEKQLRELADVAEQGFRQGMRQEIQGATGDLTNLDRLLQQTREAMQQVRAGAPAATATQAFAQPLPTQPQQPVPRPVAQPIDESLFDPAVLASSRTRTIRDTVAEDAQATIEADRRMAEQAGTSVDEYKAHWQALRDELNKFIQAKQAALAAGGPAPAVPLPVNLLAALSAPPPPPTPPAVPPSAYATFGPGGPAGPLNTGGGGGTPPVPPNIGGGGGLAPVPSNLFGPQTQQGLNLTAQSVRALKTDQLSAEQAARAHARQLLQLNQINPTGLTRFADTLRGNSTLLYNITGLLPSASTGLLRLATGMGAAAQATERLNAGSGISNTRVNQLIPLVLKQATANDAVVAATERHRLAQLSLSAAQQGGVASAQTLQRLHDRVAAAANDLSKAEQEAATATKAVSGAVEGGAATFGTMFARIVPLVAVIAVLATAITALVVGYKLLKAAIAAGSEWQQLQTRLTAVTGSATEARKTMEGFRDLRLTGIFDLPELVNAVIQLRALGIAGKEAQAVLEQMANVAAVTGDKGAQSFRQMFAEIQRSGQVTFEQIQQLREQGVNLLPELQQVTGLREFPLVLALKSATVSAEQFSAALRLANAQGHSLFGAAAREGENLAGVWQRIHTEAKLVLEDIGRPIAPALGAALQEFQRWWQGALGGVKGQGIGDALAQEITAGVEAAKQNRFGDWLGGEFAKGIDYLKRLLDSAGTWAAIDKWLGKAADNFIAKIANAVLPEDAPARRIVQAQEASTQKYGGAVGTVSTAGASINQFIGDIFGFGNNQWFRNNFGLPSMQSPQQPPAATAPLTGPAPAAPTGQPANPISVTVQGVAPAVAQQAATITGSPAYFGLNRDWSIDQTDVGRLPYPHTGAYNNTDLTNPMLAGVAIGGSQAATLTGIEDVVKAQEALLGKWVQVTNQMTGAQTFAQIVDKGPLNQQNIEATPLVHQRVGAGPGAALSVQLVPDQLQAIARAGSAAQGGGPPGGGGVTAATTLARFADVAGDASSIAQMAGTIARLTEALNAGALSWDEYNRKVQDLKNKTAQGLIDPASVTKWEHAFGTSLDDAVQHHRIAAAEIERRNAEMDAKIKTGDVDAIQSFSYGWDRAAQQYRNTSLQMQKLGEGVFNSIGNGISQAFVDIITGAKDAKTAFRDMAVSILRDIASMIIKMLVFRAVSAIVGGFTGGGSTSGSTGTGIGFGGGHEGMVVGGTPTFRRTLTLPHPNTLGHNEHFAILRKGEGVFTERQMDHLVPHPNALHVFHAEQLAAMARPNRDHGPRPTPTPTPTPIDGSDPNDVWSEPTPIPAVPIHQPHMVVVHQPVGPIGRPITQRSFVGNQLNGMPQVTPRTARHAEHPAVRLEGQRSFVGNRLHAAPHAAHAAGRVTAPGLGLPPEHLFGGGGPTGPTVIINPTDAPYSPPPPPSGFGDVPPPPAMPDVPPMPDAPPPADSQPPPPTTPPQRDTATPMPVVGQSGWEGSTASFNFFLRGKQLHDGGIAGYEGAVRMMQRDVFVHAMRMHNGFAEDEMPAVIRRNEGVFTPQQMARLAPVNNSNSTNTSFASQSNSFHTEIHIHEDGTANSHTRTDSTDNDAVEAGRQLDAKMRTVLIDEARDGGIIDTLIRRRQGRR